MKKITDFFKRIYQKIKLEKIAIVSVIVTQALKRVINSEITLFLVEILPLPWANSIIKLFGYFKKLNVIAPKVIKTIVLTKGLIDTAEVNEKLAYDLLVDHVKYYTKEQQNEFYQLFALEISKALMNDNKIDDEEIKAINEKLYKKLFKLKK